MHRMHLHTNAPTPKQETCTGARTLACMQASKQERGGDAEREKGEKGKGEKRTDPGSQKDRRQREGRESIYASSRAASASKWSCGQKERNRTRTHPPHLPGPVAKVRKGMERAQSKEERERERERERNKKTRRKERYKENN